LLCEDALLTHEILQAEGGVAYVRMISLQKVCAGKNRKQPYDSVTQNRCFKLSLASHPSSHKVDGKEISEAGPISAIAAES
jgi:hypothetical protein